LSSLEISSFIFPRKFYFSNPLISGGITQGLSAAVLFVRPRQLVPRLTNAAVMRWNLSEIGVSAAQAATEVRKPLETSHPMVRWVSNREIGARVGIDQMFLSI
jgi:hypothetical protein